MESVDNPEQQQAQQTTARYEEEQARLRERLGSPQEHQAVSAAIGGSAVEGARQDQAEESERPLSAFRRLVSLRRQQHTDVKLKHLIRQEQWRDEFFGNGLVGENYSDGRQSVAPLRTHKARIEHVASIGKSLASGEIGTGKALESLHEGRNIVMTKPDAQKKKFAKEIERTAAKLEKSSTPLRNRLTSLLQKKQPAAPRYPRPTTKRIVSFELENSLKIAKNKVEAKIQEAKDNPEPEPEAKKQR